MAIAPAVTGPAIRQHTTALGAKIQAEDGIARAVAVVNGDRM